MNTWNSKELWMQSNQLGGERLCILCDARYFLTIHDTIIYLKIFSDKKIEEKVWENKTRKGFKERMKLLGELNSAPNLKTVYEFLAEIIKGFGEKYDDILLRFAIENLRILSVFNGGDNEIDRKWIKSMLKKVKNLGFSEWEKCYFVMKALRQDADNFHDWVMENEGSIDETDDKHLIYIG